MAENTSNSLVPDVPPEEPEGQGEIKQGAMTSKGVEVVVPQLEDANAFFYPKVINAQIHPLVKYFLSLNKEQIVVRYCHLNPKTNSAALMNLLNQRNRFFLWSGADLFHVTTPEGARKMVVIESNSCPSGQKSMPTVEEFDELYGYRRVIENAFLPLLKKQRLKGDLAVIYDKNKMEASGYAQVMAQLTNESVYLVRAHTDDIGVTFKFVEGVLQIKRDHEWIPIRATWKYVTQKPWNRIPIDLKTVIANPIISCLAGGRNKLVAAKAYERFNAEHREVGLKIQAPHTMFDLAKMEIPWAIKSLGGRGVIKIPYSNAGQGVFTITSQAELDRFMQNQSDYDHYIVQSLIGNSSWSSRSPEGQLYHVGTLPNKKGRLFVADLRMMVVNGPEGFLPVCMYARRARDPLPDAIQQADDSWSVLGTNLSIKGEAGQWESDTQRLMLMDRKDFNSLGLSLDNLIDSYVQTVMSVRAIDQMADGLISERGRFRRKLFAAINKDAGLMREIEEGNQES